MVVSQEPGISTLQNKRINHMKRTKMKNRVFGILMGCLVTASCFGQQDPMYSNYMFNTLSVNPGYAGTREALSTLFLHRNQWVGIDGAPTTNTFTAHSPIQLYNLGAGLSLVQDELGPIRQTSIYADIAYRIKTGTKSHLSFGLKGGMNVYGASLTSLNINDQSDNAFSQNISSEPSPNFGFGLYYYTDRYYLGASTPKLLKNKFLNQDGGVEAEEERHLFLIAGYVFDLNTDIKFKPSVLAKIVNGAPLSLDASANFLFYDRLWLGAFWRRQDAVGALAQYWITNQFRVGYAYGYTTSELTNYNSGSHEILLGYDFVFKKAKVKSPRYF